MQILINDHSGHPFQIQLSRELAKRNHHVTHTYSANFQTPKGNFDLQEGENNIAIIPIYYDSAFNKYSLLKRKKQEEEFAYKLIAIIEEKKPEVLINSNTPLFAQKIIQKYCCANNIHFIYWCQDVYSIAMEKILVKKAGLVGKIFGAYLRSLEKNQLLGSSHIVNITDDFNNIFLKWGIKEKNMSVIPNWAPLNEIPLKSKSNPWAVANQLEGKFNVLYSGTLGLKHNPALLSDLAEHFNNSDNVRITVISEGLGAEFLKEKKEKLNLKNLEILPFQDFKDMPDVLGSADTLLAILEPEAGIFSVPSKVLTYLCAGKPIVLAVPPENLSSKIIRESHAGISVHPKDSPDFIAAVDKIYNDLEERKLMGQNARHYAEINFDIRLITDKFEKVLLHLK